MIYKGNVIVNGRFPEEIYSHPSLNNKEALGAKTLEGNLIISGANGFMLKPFGFEEITGNVQIVDTSLLWLFPKLKKIGGSLMLSSSRITGFQNLEEIGGNLLLSESSIVHLHKLQKIGKNVVMKQSKITQLLGLEQICGHMLFKDSSFVHADTLSKVNGKDVYVHPGQPLCFTPPEKNQELSL